MYFVTFRWPLTVRQFYACENSHLNFEVVAALRLRGYKSYTGFSSTVSLINYGPGVTFQIGNLMGHHDPTLALVYVRPMQSRINHCAGCTMGGLPAASGPRPSAIFLSRCFDVKRWAKFGVGLDVTTTKKVVNFFGEEKCTLRENPGSAYEKKVRDLRWLYGAPWMVNPALRPMFMSCVLAY